MSAEWRLFHALLAITLAGGMSAYFEAGQAPQGSAPLSVQDVLKFSQAGLSDELIITKIKKNAKAFDLSADELVELKKAGVSDNVIKYLLDPSLPYTPPPPPAPPRQETLSAPAAKPGTPAKQYPRDAHASKVPDEPGLYRFDEDAPQKIDVKILLGARAGPGLGKVLMKKGKSIGYIVGSAAKTRLADPGPVFYLRLPEGKSIEEVVLVAFERKSERREIDMGPAGAKPELKAEAMRPFDSVEVGPRLFRITAAKLGKGEYIFYLMGSAEPTKGNYGKGYDFGIEEPRQ